MEVTRAHDSGAKGRRATTGANIPVPFTRCWSILLPFFLAFNQHATAQAGPKRSVADLLLEYMEIRYPGLDVDGDVLYVSVRSQRMFHVRGRMLLNAYTISTSARGLGSEEDSYRTPTGLHYVRERIGAGLAAWSVLKDRGPTGEIADSTAGVEQDLITSRILWLSGMEAGLNEGGNVDSYHRWIYIHGTANEASLGRPCSRGCIRMSNRDVIALFDQVPVGTLVVIYDN